MTAPAHSGGNGFAQGLLVGHLLSEPAPGEPTPRSSLEATASTTWQDMPTSGLDSSAPTTWTGDSGTGTDSTSSGGASW